MAKPTTRKNNAAEPASANYIQNSPDDTSGNYSTTRDDAVAKLAYQLWLDRGCPEGSPEEDWLRAEQVLDAGSGPGARPAESPKRTRSMTMGANSSN
jgi:hypothetical protein